MSKIIIIPRLYLFSNMAAWDKIPRFKAHCKQWNSFGFNIPLIRECFFFATSKVEKCASTASSYIAMVFNESHYVNAMENVGSQQFGIWPCIFFRWDHSSKLSSNFVYIHIDVLLGMALVNSIFRLVIILRFQVAWI